MDPVTTLGVAAAVLQFIQFSSGLFRGVYSIYKVSRGSSPHENSLDTIHGRLLDISSDLSRSTQRPDYISRNETRLYDLAKSCHEDCNVLIVRIDKLRGKSGPVAVWSSFREALKESFNAREDSLRQLHERVMQYESSMTLHICAVLMDNGSHLKRQLHDLKIKAKDSTYDTKLRKLESHVVQLGNIDGRVSRIQDMIQQIMDKGCGSRPAEEVHDIEQLATSLEKLSLKTRDLDHAQHILDSLDYSQRPMRHGTISEAHKKTFEWALRAPAVVPDDSKGPDHNTQVDQGRLHQWLQAESGIFWISGKPGSGKSTFLKFVADHHSTKKLLGDWAQPQDVILASHYFWSTGTAMQRSQQGLWRSLLLGLLGQLPHLVSIICHEQWSEVVEHGTQYPSKHKWTSTELQECLQRVADLDPNKLPARVCLFIDGLDEFDGDHLDMLETLVNLSRSPILKLCVSSRPWNVFETSLGQSSSKIYMHELTHDDILNYTRNRLVTHPRWTYAMDGDATQGELLISSVTQRTQGVFLWVFLITKLLREGLSNEETFDELQAFIQSVPPDLEEFFKRILDGVTHVYHEKMAGFLQIAVSAEEPLCFPLYHFHENEYRDVDYSIKATVGNLKSGEIHRVRRHTSKRLDSLTRGLLEYVQDGTVQFIHRTVRDWLMTAPMRAYLKSKSTVGFNAPLAILRAHLAWYKQPFKSSSENHLWNLARTGAFYASLLYELNDPPLTVAAKSVLDGFVGATVQLWRRKVSQGRTSSEDEPVNNLKLLGILVKAELWDYIWHKLDEMPEFLRRVIESPGSVELEQFGGAGKADAVAFRSRVATVLLGALINKLTGGHLIEPTQRQRRLGHDTPSAHRNKVLQAISGLICNLQADPKTEIVHTPAWIHILLCLFTTETEDIDQETQQCMKEAIEKALDGLEIDHYMLLVQKSDGEKTTIWGMLCDHICTLGRLRERKANTESLGPPQPDFQAEALAICIANLSGAGCDFPWERLRTAIEHAYQGEALELLLGTMEEHGVPCKKETSAAQ